MIRRRTNSPLLFAPLLSCHHHQVDLYIDRLQRAASSSASGGSSKQEQLSYKCIFDKKEQTVATSTQFGLSCPLPKVMHRPKIQPGKGMSHPFLISLSPTSRPLHTKPRV